MEKKWIKVTSLWLGATATAFLLCIVMPVWLYWQTADPEINIPRPTTSPYAPIPNTEWLEASLTKVDDYTWTSHDPYLEVGFRLPRSSEYGDLFQVKLEDSPGWRILGVARDRAGEQPCSFTKSCEGDSAWIVVLKDPTDRIYVSLKQLDGWKPWHIKAYLGRGINPQALKPVIEGPTNDK